MSSCGGGEGQGSRLCQVASGRLALPLPAGPSQQCPTVRGAAALPWGRGGAGPGPPRGGLAGRQRGKKAELPRPVPAGSGASSRARQLAGAAAGGTPPLPAEARRENGCGGRPDRGGCGGWVLPGGGVTGDRCDSPSDAGPIMGVLPGPGGTTWRRANPVPMKMSRRGLRHGTRAAEATRVRAALGVGGAGRVSGDRGAARCRAAESRLHWSGSPEKAGMTPL